MGLTAWVARYQLPNARPTEACEWTLPERAAPAPPAERLHALLDEAEAAPRQVPPASTAGESARPRPPRRARQLLGIEPEGEAAETDSAPVSAKTVNADAPSPEPSPETSPETTPGISRQTQKPLRFTLQLACLAGRWLVFVPQPSAPDVAQSELLSNALKAAGIDAPTPLAFETFRWPPMENLPVEAPLEEAREGLAAFVEGTQRRGWSPERVLIFGHDETLARLLEMSEGEGRIEPLGLPGWQGPGLDELVQSAAAKRSLWPTLLAWRQAWLVKDAEADD
ncbi:hypothetical protein HOP53_13220 [Halomonas sp. MCCC 1A11081]|uniref:Histidine phosphatase family protein n=2 Tax=Billgrantia ethanolica TaxID=2733486 RepID=A0ABS9A632_9GAMM|nr:hypothetical protein [Halomonas ethanolica]MCE8003803.1 hypothetical protein [Halomonas ethanolica]